jgi:hypothetical protein
MAEVFKIKRTVGPDGEFHVTEVSGNAAVWGPTILVVFVTLAITHNLAVLVPVGGLTSLSALVSKLARFR